MKTPDTTEARLDAFLSEFELDEQERILRYALDHIVPRLKSRAALASEAQGARSAEAPFDVETLKEQAGAWLMVAQTLHEVAPWWTDGPSNGRDSACSAIRRLATHPAHPQVAAVVPKAQIAPNSREAQMVTVRTKDGEPTVWCDPEIADLVDALNTDKLATIASCSGHGHRPGSIALKDGRWLFVATEEQRQVIEATFPVDVNGAVAPKAQAEAADTRRLDHLQERGATVDLVNVAPSRGIDLQFRVGGLHKSLSPDLRAAIDYSIAIRSATGAKE